MNNKDMDNNIRMVSYGGGGTNSTAMLVGLVQMRSPIDFILFADTGGEHESTYAYITYFSKWLKKQGYPEITVVKKVRRNGTVMTLEEDCLEKGMLPSIAYGYKTCSQKYKIAPQDKYVNNYPGAKKLWKRGEKITKYVGFDAGESRRVHTERDAADPKYQFIYPLIEWGWDRSVCIEQILKAGLCLPGKSSCIYCPNMHKEEILSLSPTDKKRVITMERTAAPNLTDIVGLGRSYRWEDLINADEAQQKLFDDLDMYRTPCECVD